MFNTQLLNRKNLLKSLALCFSLILFLLAMPLACGNQEPENGNTTVSLGFSPMQLGLGWTGTLLKKFQDNYNPYPSVISEMVVTVTYQDQGQGLKRIEKRVPGGSLSGSTRIFIEVPSGPARTIRLEAFDRGGSIIFSGETTQDLPSNQSVTKIDIALSFQCHGTAWDAQGDTLIKLAQKIGLDALGLGFLSNQISLNITDEYDLLSLSLTNANGQIRITAAFTDSLKTGSFSGAVLLDTDNNPLTPATSVISQLFPQAGADFLVLIQPGGETRLIDLSGFTGTYADLPNAGQTVSLQIIDKTARIDFSLNLAGTNPGPIGFLGVFGSNSIPTDLAPDWGMCLSE